MKIKDPAHAVRVLKALVEQGPKFIEHDVWLLCAYSAPLVPALVEGAKAMLSRWEAISEKHQKYFDDGGDKLLGEFWAGRKEEANGFIVINAQAYAPGMKEAGMTVPK